MTHHKRKKKKVRGKRKGSGKDRPVEALHAFVPAIGTKGKFLDLFQYYFKKELRNSPIWDEMIDKYGREKAEVLLEEIKFSAK
ncbi:MAG: hypothetical protein JXR67_06045 [Bacteroidales bacterium]|nr:hypothetical protein [Bacteroidales bacterium]